MRAAYQLHAPAAQRFVGTTPRAQLIRDHRGAVSHAPRDHAANGIGQTVPRTSAPVARGTVVAEQIGTLRVQPGEAPHALHIGARAVPRAAGQD